MASPPRTFAELGLSATSQAGLAALGFELMTPVQAAAIPLLLQYRDVSAEACTGSGKTLAFVIPAIELILRRDVPLKPRAVGALIISPTRELANQTFAVCAHFAACSNGQMAPPLLITGGAAVAADLKMVADAKALPIVVATPGRLDDLLERYELFDMKSLELLVLDEADTLLNMGFQQALSRILSRLPKQRRTGLFSATQTREVKELGRAGLRNPASISVAVKAQAQAAASSSSAAAAASSAAAGGAGKAAAGGGGHSTVGVVFEKWGVQATPTSLSNHYALTSQRLKPLLLLRFLHEHRGEKVMVFFLTCAAVDFWERALNALPADALAGVTVAAVAAVAAQARERLALTSEGAAAAAAAAAAPPKAKANSGTGNGLRVLGLHGRMVQKKRNGVFAQFRGARSSLDVDAEAAAGASAGSRSSGGGSSSSSSGASPGAKEPATPPVGAVLLCTDVAARGLDVPDVDWIVQFDAPQDPAAFVHRVGRAGRAGRVGASLLLMDPHEDAYVEFLALRKIPLAPFAAWADLNQWWKAAEDRADAAAAATEAAAEAAAAAGASETSGGGSNIAAGSAKRAKKATALAAATAALAATPLVAALELASERLEGGLRSCVRRDRDLLERGSRAFMAHLRAYKDHRCEFIFRFHQLDLGGLANAFALLRLPKIPELSGRGAPRVRGFAPDFTFKTEAVPYLDKSREKARLKRLAVSKEAAAAAEQLEAAAHAAAGPQAFKQLSGAAKKQAANLAEAQKHNPKWTAEGPRKRKGKREAIQEEWDDLAKEERLYKKLKKGKLTQKQYEAALKGQDAGGSDAGESGGEGAGGSGDESD